MATKLTGTDTIEIKKIAGGAPTSLASYNQEIANGDSIGLLIVGNQLTAYFKAAAGSWAALGTAITDSTYTGAGSIGVYCYDATCRLDGFGGGTPVAASTLVPVIMFQNRQRRVA